jgi:hypothetical protein
MRGTGEGMKFWRWLLLPTLAGLLAVSDPPNH